MGTSKEKMNMEDIEQIKKERDVILGLAFKLVGFLKETATEPNLLEDEKSVIAAVEAFKPKPEQLECWLAIWADGSKTVSLEEPKRIYTAGPLRSVRLVEAKPAPEWEKWVCYHGSNEIHTPDKRIFGGDIHVICEAHNEEMKRVTGTEGK